MTFPDAIKWIRDRLDLTQAELAQALNVSYATINRWENGKHFPAPLVRAAIRAYCSKSGLDFPFQERQNHEGEC